MSPIIDDMTTDQLIDLYEQCRASRSSESRILERKIATRLFNSSRMVTRRGYLYRSEQHEPALVRIKLVITQRHAVAFDRFVLRPATGRKCRVYRLRRFWRLCRGSRPVAAMAMQYLFPELAREGEFS